MNKGLLRALVVIGALTPAVSYLTPNQSAAATAAFHTTTARSSCNRLRGGTPLASRRQEAGATRLVASMTGQDYPEMCVFDLDGPDFVPPPTCLWDKEMFEMPAIPTETVMGDLNGRGQGVVGAMSGREKISLHKGALIALQEVHDGKFPGMKIAAASSADTPFAVQIGRKALTMLEVVPGVTVWDLLLREHGGEDVNQIGRTPPLSSDKSATHFPILKDKTGVPYDKQLFFDDCNWGDHCGKVERACRESNGKGVVTVRTPSGLHEQDWREGLRKYAAAQQAVAK